MNANSTSAVDPFELVVSKLRNPKATAKGVRACCPAHDDETPSLDVDRGDNGVVLLTCRSAGCTADDIVAAIGLTKRDLFPEGSKAAEAHPTSPGKKEPKRHATLDALQQAATWSATDRNRIKDFTTKRYDYTAADGSTVGGVFRFDFADGRQKELRRFRRDGDAWVLKDMEEPRPLYHLHDLVKADTNEPILFVEGEKCVEAVFTLGLIGTTSSGGAKQPIDKSDFSVLANRHVVILPDNDAPGRQYAEGIAKKAHEAGAASVHRLELQGLKEGEDVYDWAVSRDNSGMSKDQIADELRQLLLGAEEVPVEQAASSGDPEAGKGAEEGWVRLGEVDPTSGKLVLSPKKTLPTAIVYLRQFCEHQGDRTLYDYCGVLWSWRGNRYVEVEDAAIEGQLHRWLHRALRYEFNKQSNTLKLVAFDSNPTTVAAAIKTIKRQSFITKDTEVPSWLGGDNGQLPVLELLPCKNITLHVPTQTVLQPTPRLFVQNALEFDYDPLAPEPERWIAFLRELWGDDDESIGLLQEWFGYSLIADTSQQKMLLLIGPRRSGKGTIGRVLKELVGGRNVVGPTTSSLTGPFGLQPLLGKSLAIVSDARFTGDAIPTLVERLLVISGEDAVTVDRKHLTSVTQKLPVRFMFLSNELPRFTDASTALAGRFMVLRLATSFYGKENPNLTKELLAELPGILLWAITGWLRLRDRGRFDEPASSREAVQDIEDLSSPVSAFVRERCVVGPGHRVPVGDIFFAWQSWCMANGRNTVANKQMFGRDLSAAISGVSARRGSENARFYDGIGLRPSEAGA